MAVDVQQVGALVVLGIGNLRFSLEFQVALLVSAALRTQGTIAKLQSGDLRRGPRAFGVLNDASAPRARRRRFAEKLPALLRPRDIDCKAEGALVALRFGGNTARMPYDAALTIAQWLRVRAKQAKAYEGEPRHWSEIQGAAAARN